MNVKINSLLLFIVFVLFAGCTYQIPDEAFTKIDPASPRNFQIDFFSSKDTLYVGWDMLLNFKPPQDKDIIGTTIYVDGKNVIESNGAIDSYSLKPSDLQDGYRTLRLQYLQKSKSGSLADQLNAEVFTFTFDRVILIDNAIVNPLKITKTEIVDSTLVVYWDTFKGYKFESYTINYGLNSVVLTDPKIDHISIPEFPGGSLDFNFTVKAKQIYSVFSVDSYTYNLHFTADLVKLDSMRLSWEPSPFKAMKNATVSLSFYGNELPITSMQLNYGTTKIKTLVPFQVSFPYNFSLTASLNTILKKSEQLVNKTFSAAGENVQKPDVAYLINDSTFLYGYFDYTYVGSSYIDRFTCNGNELRQNAMGISLDGKLLYNAKMSSANQLKLDRYDPGKLTLVGTSYVTVPLAANTYIPTVHVSNDGYVMITYGLTYPVTGYQVINIQTNSVVYSGSTSYGPTNDGRLDIGGRYYMDTESSLDLSALSPKPVLTNSDYSYSDPVINLPHRNQFVYYDPTYQELRLNPFPAGGASLVTIPFEGTYVDAQYNETNLIAVLVKKSDNTYWVDIFNLDSGTQVYTFKLSNALFTDADRYTRFKLINRTFWIEHGAEYNDSRFNF